MCMSNQMEEDFQFGDGIDDELVYMMMEFEKNYLSGRGMEVRQDKDTIIKREEEQKDDPSGESSVSTGET